MVPRVACSADESLYVETASAARWNSRWMPVRPSWNTTCRPFGFDPHLEVRPLKQGCVLWLCSGSRIARWSANPLVPRGQEHCGHCGPRLKCFFGAQPFLPSKEVHVQRMGVGASLELGVVARDRAQWALACTKNTVSPCHNVPASINFVENTW